jgi:hypothetical protein
MAIRSLLLLFLILVLSFTVQANETEGDYEYWYAISQDGGVRIEIFSPATETTRIYHSFALVGYKAYFSNAIFSANQEWLAYTRSNGSYYDVYIVNLQTYTHQLVMENIFIDPDNYNIEAGYPFLEWSPTDSILLIRAFEPQNYPDIVNYLFDTENSQAALQVTLSENNYDYGNLERADWADDGRLLILQEFCIRQLGCEMRPTIRDARTFEETAFTGEKFLYTWQSSCGFRWTSDEAYIAYIDTCDISNVEGESEVYLYNNHEDELTALTHFTEGTAIPNLYRAFYSLFWLDNQRLLIGANYNDASGEYNQTLLYTIQSQTLETIDTVSGADWMYSPNHQYIVYRTQSGFFPDPLSTMRILDANNLTTIREEEIFACNFSWSGDSQWLAYKEQPANWQYRCSFSASQIKLLNLESSEVLQISLSDETRLIPLGWVQVQNQ